MALAVAFLAAAALSVEAVPRPVGWISLTVRGEPGAEVVLREDAAEVARGRMRDGTVELPRVAQWRCDRLVRTFSVIDSTGGSDSVRLRTPSCRTRLELGVRRRGREVLVTVFDRFRIGGAQARVCVRPPGDAARCQAAAIPPGRETTILAHASRPGLWRATATAYGRALRASTFVAPRGGLRVLATGDSMMQLSLATFLARRLTREGMSVRGDTHPGSGITKPFVLDWTRLARRQAARRPAATVMFLGANDGLPLGGARCCGEAWIERYAERAAEMMRSYARGGASRVYWLTLPVPSWRHLRPVFRAVNAALERAAARTGARIVDTAEYFTPNGFRRAMRVGGRRVIVKRRDGIHLNGAGAALAARLVARAMRRDGLVRR